MMKFTLIALLAGSATAFAPAQSSVRSSSALLASFEDRPGALPPIGYFDPLGLATSEETFDFYRSVEIKHGRVAMLAVVGYVVPEFYRFGYDLAPGISTNDIPNGFAAIEAVPALGWVQIVFLIGAVDYYGFLGDFDMGKPNLAPDILAKRQTQELQNGRLAMLGFSELLRHDWQNYIVPGFDGNDKLITGLPFLY